MDYARLNRALFVWLAVAAPAVGLTWIFLRGDMWPVALGFGLLLGAAHAGATYRESESRFGPTLFGCVLPFLAAAIILALPGDKSWTLALPFLSLFPIGYTLLVHAVFWGLRRQRGPSED